MKEFQDKLAEVTQPFLFQNSFILRDLPKDDLLQIEAHMQFEERKRGELLFRQGAFPKSAYWLLSGKIKIFQGLEDGQRQTLYIYSDGDLIGYRQLIGEEPNPVSATFLEDSVIRYLPGDVFRGLISTSPFFARNVLFALAREFSVWMNRMTVFKKFSVQRRLILALLILHEQYRLSGSRSITITRTDLAEYVGASLETVVRSLNTLKSDNLVQVKGRQLQLPNITALIKLVQSEEI